MKEGKLSSALMERYGITEGDAIGKVLWHSLNESGEIGVYDMKFGDTIIRNLLSEDIEATVQEGHGHPPKRNDDKERSKKRSPNRKRNKKDNLNEAGLGKLEKVLK
jgi:hypothetical protein